MLKKQDETKSEKQHEINEMKKAINSIITFLNQNQQNIQLPETESHEKFFYQFFKQLSYWIP